MSIRSIDGRFKGIASMGGGEVEIEFIADQLSITTQEPIEISIGGKRQFMKPFVQSRIDCSGTIIESIFHMNEEFDIGITTEKIKRQVSALENMNWRNL
jgi:hypothetical protein